MTAPKFSRVSPGRILVLSFLFVVSAGSLLLSLPISRVVDIPIIDIFFSAFSATCVTGLRAIPISYFSTFGKCVILALIQIGGLGLMTLSFFMISLVLNLRLITKIVAGQILEFEFSGKIKTFLKLIVGFTFFSELCGALVLYLHFGKVFEVKKAIFYSIFHSVASFCNSGVTLFEDGFSACANMPLPLITMSVLIFLGGIGFVVWYELSDNFIDYMKAKFGNEKKKITTSLHTKVALFASVVLIIAGAILFYILEKDNSMKSFGMGGKLLNSFFMSVSSRTAGFDTVAINHLALPTLLVLIVLMFIGASSSSTGGGVKVTTFTIFIATIIAIVKNKESVELFGRRIPDEQIFKTTVIMALGMTWVAIVTFVLLITEKDFTFIQVFFESVSAFSTTGLSTGITPFLSSWGKILLMFTMFLGRIGALTLVLALRKKTEHQLYSFPEERVILG